jgi:hypothetical protein
MLGGPLFDYPVDERNACRVRDRPIMDFERFYPVHTVVAGCNSSDLETSPKSRQDSIEPSQPN